MQLGRNKVLQDGKDIILLKCFIDLIKGQKLIELLFIKPRRFISV